jgi:hypothetical protein
MVPVFARASKAGSMAGGQWRCARRALIAVWLALSVAGALNFDLLSARFFAPRGALTAFLPHLQFGHVMFDRVPRTITVPSVTFDGSTTHRGLSAVLQTDSIGYSDARGYLGFALAPGWEDRICSHIGERQDVTIWLRRFVIRETPQLTGQRALRCGTSAR